MSNFFIFKSLCRNNFNIGDDFLFLLNVRQELSEILENFQ